jgi:hypothetical protein
MNAIYTFVGIAGGIIFVWALLRLIGGHSGSMDPLAFFFESSTMGTILVLVVYFPANLALPFYYRKYRPASSTCSSTWYCRCSGWWPSPCPCTTWLSRGRRRHTTGSRTQRWG